MLIQHIALAEEWAAAQAAGHYDRSTRGTSIEQVGFLHASDGPDQMATVLAAVYADVTEPLVLLTLDPAALFRAGLRVVLEPGDPARPDGGWFPHVYGGPIPAGAVADVVPIERPAGVAREKAASDEPHLRRAIHLATANAAAGGQPFGAVLVTADGRVVTGVNRTVSAHDPTAHAEVEALRAAGAVTGDTELSGSVVYASCEPCPMCVTASVWARVSRIVYAADRRDAAAAGFSDEALYQQLGLAEDGGREGRMPLVRRPVERSLEPFTAWRRARRP